MELAKDIPGSLWQSQETLPALLSSACLCHHLQAKLSLEVKADSRPVEVGVRRQVRPLPASTTGLQGAPRARQRWDVKDAKNIHISEKCDFSLIFLR